LKRRNGLVPHLVETVKGLRRAREKNVRGSGLRTGERDQRAGRRRRAKERPGQQCSHGVRSNLFAVA
jgi:hypothetical protein